MDRPFSRAREASGPATPARCRCRGAARRGRTGCRPGSRPVRRGSAGRRAGRRSGGRARFRRPPRRPSVGRPMPSSVTVTTSTPSSAVTETSARFASACRATLLRASPMTAITWSATARGTSVSISPSIRSAGVNPRAGAASSIAWTTRVRSVGPPLELPCSRRPKMVERMILMVESRSSIARPSRSAAPGCSTSGRALCRVIPVANSRWTARSCRSRAIRSRSSRRLICSASRRRSASSRARAAWSARPGRAAISASMNVGRPSSRARIRTPLSFSWVPTVTATAGPNPFHLSGSTVTLGSLATSGTVTRPSCARATAARVPRPLGSTMPPCASARSPRASEPVISPSGPRR